MLTLVITSREDGSERRVAAWGTQWADALRRIGRAEGIGDGVDACASVSERLVRGEQLCTVGFIYEVVKAGGGPC